MKRLLGVVLVLFVACIPMNIHAKEVVNSFEYTGQKIEVEESVGYYLIDDGVFVSEAPIDCGRYRAFYSDGSYIEYEIIPKVVHVNVRYNKDWRENDPEDEKYLCEYVGDYEFKLRTDTNGNFISLDRYEGNYEFQFEPKNAKDVEVVKTQVTHPDVEYVYSEDGIMIYSGIDHVEPIILKDVGEYTVAFNLDERYYESVPFKVTILPKTIQLKLNKQFKYFGQQDPVLKNDDYILSREPGEDVGDYKLSVKSKSKNYRYEIVENDVFSILDRNTENVRMDTSKGSGASDETKTKEKVEVNQSESKVKTGVSDFTLMYVGLLILSMVGLFQIKRMK